MSPFSQIGSSNVIHGPQWLSQQPADQYAIQVVAVADRKEMYDIAQRYNRYLKDELSYYTVNSGKYVLISGGYATEPEADAVIWRLPRHVNFQRPTKTRMSDIQQRLSL